MKKTLNTMLGIASHNKIITMLIVTIFVIMNINAGYISYPDEFVNLWGGRALLQGQLPYRDYFDHHMPLAWYISAIILIVSKHNIVIFKSMWALVQFGIFMFGARVIYQANKNLSRYYLLFVLAHVAISIYYWMHLFLGDALAVLFFQLPLWILLTASWQRKISTRDAVIAGVFLGLTVFSSLSFLYLAAVCYGWCLCLQFGSAMGRGTRLSGALLLAAKTLGIWLLPYALYAMYLVLTGSLSGFMFSNFTYNTTLYISIPNFVAGASRFNPLRFALIVVDNFWGSYITLLTMLADPNFYRPTLHTIASGTLATIVLFLLRRNWYVFFYIVAMSFIAPRTLKFFELKETDYQASMFIVFGLVSAVFAIYALLQDLEFKHYFVKFMRSVALFFIVAYVFFTVLFGVFNVLHTRYKIYMGTFAPVSNISDLADFLSTKLDQDDYFWVGPFESHHAFFVRNGKFVTKYPSLLPQFRESEYLRTDFIKQFETYKPKIIVFKRDASIFMTPAIEFGEFFLAWMKGRYVSCQDLGRKCDKATVLGFRPNEDIYVRTDVAAQVFEGL